MPSFFATFGARGDVAPPGRITDLVIVDKNNSTREVLEVTMQWTAPGGDYDRGAGGRTN